MELSVAVFLLLLIGCLWLVALYIYKYSRVSTRILLGRRKNHSCKGLVYVLQERLLDTHRLLLLAFWVRESL